MGKIAVIGSVNMDVVNQVERHPEPGETIKGKGTTYMPGGKGANQAVAAAKSGGDVMMLGAVGEDAFGSVLVETLQGYGVDTRWMKVQPGSSGLAFITVDDAGENAIILSEGANGLVGTEELEAAWEQLSGASSLLLQNEIPWETTERAMQKAHEAGARVFYNPAPAAPVPAGVLPLIHGLVANESELQLITGLRADTPEFAEKAARQLVDEGVRMVVATLGSAGVVCVTREGETLHVPAFKVNAVDTTAAGDTFIGAWVAALEAGLNLHRSLKFANAAAALTVTRRGAQDAIALKHEIDAFLHDLV